MLKIVPNQYKFDLFKHFLLKIEVNQTARETLVGHTYFEKKKKRE